MCTVPIDMKYTQNAHPHTLKSHPCTMSTVYTTLDYSYSYNNKCTGMVLVHTDRKCGVHKLDHESYKMCTVYVLE